MTDIEKALDVAADSPPERPRGYRENSGLCIQRQREWRLAAGLPCDTIEITEFGAAGLAAEIAKMQLNPVSGGSLTADDFLKMMRAGTMKYLGMHVCVRDGFGIDIS